MEINAYAKINITLDVLRKRKDGYHDVKMLMQTVSLCDKIWLYRSAKGICVQTNLRFLPSDGRNIAYRAAELFLRQAGIAEGVNIRIKKNIPVAAGLAGGSADAAAVLRGLNRMFGSPFSVEELMKMGGELGSDVPYCVTGGMALAEGRGELLTKIAALPRAVFLLAKPPLHVSTPWVYGNLKLDTLKEHPDTAGCIRAMEERDLRGVASRMFNVLESVTVPAYPIIRKLKEAMAECGCVGCVMSGSGPTVIGMFEQYNRAKAAETVLKKLTGEVFLAHPVNSYSL